MLSCVCMQTRGLKAYPDGLFPPLLEIQWAEIVPGQTSILDRVMDRAVPMIPPLKRGPPSGLVDAPPPPCGKNDISISAYVPVHFRQTNNTAELLAVVRALQILSFGKVAICTDSEYVFLGATSAARRWKLRGWTGSSGPVSNVPLWELLLDTLGAHTGSIKFIKVPSHVDILGNNEADRLADQGRLSHPKCPVLKTPSRDFIMPTYTPPHQATAQDHCRRAGLDCASFEFFPPQRQYGRQCGVVVNIVSCRHIDRRFEPGL